MSKSFVKSKLIKGKSRNFANVRLFKCNLVALSKLVENERGPDLYLDLKCLFDYWLWVDFQGLWNWGADWAIAFIYFDRSINTVSIRGADYSHQITTHPSFGFLDLPTGLTLTYCLMMRGGRIYETAHTAVLKQKPVSLARNQPKKQKFT